MNHSHLSIMRHNTTVAEHKLQISLEAMASTMRDYDMAPEARAMFRVIRGDLEYCLETVQALQKTLANQREPDKGESAQVVTP